MNRLFFFEKYLRNSYAQTQFLANSITYNSIIVWDEDNERYKRIDLDQVLYVRSDKKHCRIYVLAKEKYFIVRCTMTEFLERINDSGPVEEKEEDVNTYQSPEAKNKSEEDKKLYLSEMKTKPAQDKKPFAFCRIHNKYIIPLNQIDYPSEDLTSVVLRCNEELPVGRIYLPEFKKAARIF